MRDASLDKDKPAIKGCKGALKRIFGNETISLIKLHQTGKRDPNLVDDKQFREV